ncbi:MAG TPA: aminotransferase class IV [Saprospiraceae bacterium]|nr:aminotransferase class IV [Saprospiraceae bacterium]
MMHYPQFIETIKLEGRRLHNLAYHNARVNKTRREVLHINEPLDLAEHIPMPEEVDQDICKCRVTYGWEVSSVEIEYYEPKRIRSLRLIEGGNIDYKYKYADRSAINTLYARREGCDDILIVKDDLITDTASANVAFSDGKEWWTPSTPLLAGTKRQQLLDEGGIKEMFIRPSDLTRFSQFVVFNAMMEFDARNGRPVTGIQRG